MTKAEAEQRLQELKLRAQKQHDVWRGARATQEELTASRQFLEQQLQAIATELRAQQRVSRDAAARRTILLDEIKRLDRTSTWKPTDTKEDTPR